MNKYFYNLFFLLLCTCIVIKSSEPSEKINYKNQTINDNLKTFFNSFYQTKHEHDIQKNYHAAAWNASGTKQLLNAYNLKSFINTDIQEELDDILIHSHTYINKSHLILSDIQKFNHKVNSSIEIIKNEKNKPELRIKHLNFLWKFATQKNNMQAQCIMAHAYYRGLYGVEKNSEKALKYSDYYTENLANNFNKQTLPLERFAVYAFLHECTDTYAKILLLYCQHIELLLAKDNALLQKTFTLSHNILDKQSAIRNEILALLCNTEKLPKQKSTKLHEMLYNHNFADFISSDGDFAIPLLQNKLISNNQKDDIHHVLGLIFYQKNQLKDSYKHFNSIIPHLEKEKDVLSLCKLFDALNQSTLTLSLDHIQSGINILKIIFNNKALTKHLPTICNLLKYDALPYAKILLNNKKYKDAYFLAQKCMHYSDTYSTGLSIIHLISDSLDPNNNKYEKQLNTLYHSFAYQKIKELSEKDNTSDSYKCMCQIIAHHAIFQKNIISHKTAHCIEYVLNNNLCLESEISQLKKLCSDFYYQKAQTSNSFNDYNKATVYGNTKAIAHKAWLMLSSKNLSEEILNQIEHMLDDYLPEENNELLIKIFSKIATIYSKPIYKEESDDTYPHIKSNASKGFYYSKKAYDLGDTEKGALLLAQYYFEGVPNILQTDSNKVIEICTHCIKSNHKHDPLCFFLRGFSFYDTNNYNNAYNDFSKIINSLLFQNNDNKEAHQQIWLRMGLIKLKNIHSKNARTTALKYFDKAFILFPTDKLSVIAYKPFEAKILTPYLYNKYLFKQLKIYTDHIITTQSKEKTDLSLCYYAGGIFYFATKQNKYKQHALQCLKYTAKNNHVPSVVSLASLPEEDVNHYQKIKYIEKVLTPENIDLFCFTFSDILPRTIKKKYEFIINLKNDHNKIQKYLSSTLFTLFDLGIEHIFFTETDNTLAEQALTDDLLKNYVQEFNLTLDKAPPYVKNGTFLYALMLACSNNIKYLQTSAAYLNKLATHSDEKTSALLGLCYLKIGNHFFQQKQNILAMSYLKKSAELGNKDAKISLNNIEKNSSQNIVLSTKTQNSAIMKSYEIYEFPLMTKQAVTKQVTTKQTLPGNTLLKTLVAFRESEELLNKKYQKALSQVELANTNNVAINMIPFENLANKEQHPHATLRVAAHFFAKNNIPMTIKCIILGLDNAFISFDQKKSYLFKDEHLLALLSNLLVNIIKKHNNPTEVHNVVRCVKKILQNYTIDLKAFIEYTKKSFSYDLIQNTSWTALELLD